MNSGDNQGGIDESFENDCIACRRRIWFAAAPIAVAADDAATIRANTEAWFKAFNAGNADAVAAAYADDAVVMAPGAPPASGSAAIK